MLSALKEFVFMRSMVQRWHILGIAIFLGAVASVALAQPAKEKKSKAPPAEKAPPSTSPPAPAAAAPAADANRPAAAEYQRLLEEWKTVLKEMRKLKLQYQSGGFADQAEAQKGWTTLVEKGNETVAKLEAAGLKAYAEAPNEDPQLTRFLVKLSDDAIQRDDYASAKQVTEVLIAHQCPDKQILDAAAIAAFVLNK